MRGCEARVLLMLAWCGCATAAAPVMTLPAQRLYGTDRAEHDVPARDGYTVLVFFSSHCDVQRAHDPRLLELSARYAARRVSIYAVDSEIDAALARDALEAERRGYPFPILIDTDGALARALGAEYSTFSVLLDGSGRVVYRGGIDADQIHLRADTTAYLANALDDVLVGRPVGRASGSALGCSLRVASP